MEQNAPPWTPLGSLQCSPGPLNWFKRAASRLAGRGREGRKEGKEGREERSGRQRKERAGMKGREREGSWNRALFG